TGGLPDAPWGLRPRWPGGRHGHTRRTRGFARGGGVRGAVLSQLGSPLPGRGGEWGILGHRAGEERRGGDRRPFLAALPLRCVGAASVHVGAIAGGEHRGRGTARSSP